MTTVAKAVNGLHDVAIAVCEKKGIEDAKPFLKKLDYALALIKKQKKQINSFQYRLCQQITTNTQLQNEIERLNALLKEQQPKKPIYDCPLIVCPRCKNTIYTKQKYCDECGQAIAWKEANTDGA